MARESAYQARLIKKLEKLFPGSLVIKNDPQQRQGIPDILILFRSCWGMLEVKRSPKEETQPNQEYYVDKFNKMSFASFINPENEEQVLDDLQKAFGVSR